MNMYKSLISVLLLVIIGCNINDESVSQLVAFNSPEYYQRLKKAKVSSQRVYSLVSRNSKLKPIDSIILSREFYTNGLCTRRFCYTYLDKFPGYDEYPYSSIDYHDIFDRPFDYNSLCYVSKYSYDSLGSLKMQIDSINWMALTEYQKRSGRTPPDAIKSFGLQDWISTVTKKWFASDSRDSMIIEIDEYKQGLIGTIKLYDWISDSVYLIRSLPLSKFNTKAEALNAFKNNQGELVEVGLRSKSPFLKMSETYTVPGAFFNKPYTGYGKLPTTVINQFALEPRKYARVKRDVYFKSTGYYDSIVLIYDKNDSLLSEVQHRGSISNLNEKPRGIKIENSKKYQRRTDGLITSMKEDDYLFQVSKLTNYNYKTVADKIVGKEQMIKKFDEQGRVYSTETNFFTYDYAGNLLQEESEIIDHEDTTNDNVSTP